MTEVVERKIEIREIESIQPYELNAKIHEPNQIKRIAESIKAFGWTQPIVVDQGGSIIAGHGRRLAAISLGMTKVPVIVRDDLTEDEVRALRLADNRVAISGMDGEKLQAELATLNFDMDGIFDKKELDFMEADLSAVDATKFIADIDSAVREQAIQTAEKVSAADEREVPIAKALGFKTIKTKDEKYVATLMAVAEDQTGKTGGDAFIAYVRLLSQQA